MCKSSRLIKAVLYSSLAFICSHNASADVASLESNFVAGLIPQEIVDHLNNDRTTLTNSTNNIRGVSSGGVQTSGQIKADTVGEENMADDANPRIRTAEGASCSDFVYSGMLPSTSSSLVGSVPTGTAYPDGYYVNKTSATAKTFTASTWTYVYVLTNGTIDYQEVAIQGSQPSDLPTSAILARVSTDATTINNVTDLRKTSCAAGPFNAISDVTGEASLGDLLSVGRPVRVSANTGWIQGLQVSWNTVTTFTVLPGSVYINGKYRVVSTNTTVTQSLDDPAGGLSGLDTGAIAASTTYNVFAVGDQTNSKSFSVTISTASAPAGVTNYRKIGIIKTDGASKFISGDVTTIGSIMQKELIGAIINFDSTTAGGAIYWSYNVSSITDNAGGDFTLTWDEDFTTSSNAVIAGSAQVTAGSPVIVGISTTNPTAGAVRINMRNDGAGLSDSAIAQVIAIGEKP